MSPLIRRLFAVYAILALAAFAFPGGLVTWLDDRNASGWLDAPLALARGVDGLSATVGIKPLAQKLRAQFRVLTGGDEG